MTPEQEAHEWANVNYVMELVKNEGDKDCERAFDFLILQLREHKALLKEAWQFPDFPSPGEGMVSEAFDIERHNRWLQEWHELNEKIQKALK